LSAIAIFVSFTLRYRIPWGLSHGAAHIIAALSCAIFVELAIEWAVHMGVVGAEGGVGSDRCDDQCGGLEDAATVSQSMLQDYHKIIFNSSFLQPFFQTFSDEAADKAKEHMAAEQPEGGYTAYVADRLIIGFSWVSNNVPLVNGMVHLLDLPEQLSTSHVGMCAALCAGGAECFAAKSAAAWSGLSRFQVSYYIGGWSLYFLVIAIPCAGSIFGTWLALTLTAFGSQWNEGFSSLRIQHYKNFIRCHIKKNGDLEIHAIGLDIVPKAWVMDEEWGGTKAEKEKRREKRRLESEEDDDLRADTPSFLWEKPSMWVPTKAWMVHKPRLIEKTVIRKRVAVMPGQGEVGDEAAGTTEGGRGKGAKTKKKGITTRSGRALVF